MNSYVQDNRKGGIWENVAEKTAGKRVREMGRTDLTLDVSVSFVFCFGPRKTGELQRQPNPTPISYPFCLFPPPSSRFPLSFDHRHRIRTSHLFFLMAPRLDNRGLRVDITNMYHIYG